MSDKSTVNALRSASATVDVPGTPLSLRLDAVAPGDEQLTIKWSFRDPETPSDTGDGRVRGTTGIPVRDTTDLADARRWWAKAQLDAAHAYALKIDADWMPGQPFVERVWDVDEAWAALLGHLRAYGGSVTEEADQVRVVHRGQETIYRFDPQTWADYLNGIGEDPLESAADDDLAIVPAALPSVDGLPLWAVDDLNETTDTRGPIIGIVEGKLVGLDSVC